MADRPTCPDCGARPVPTPKAKRCLACAKKLPGGAWRQLIARYRDREGEDAARAMAEAQGVPYSPAASPASCTAPPKKKRAPRKKRSAPTPSTKDIEPLALGRLAGRALQSALEKITQHIESDDITPGQLAQMVKPLHGLWSEVSGGTTASDVRVVFRQAPPREDAA